MCTYFYLLLNGARLETRVIQRNFLEAAHRHCKSDLMEIYEPLCLHLLQLVVIKVFRCARLNSATSKTINTWSCTCPKTMQLFYLGLIAVARDDGAVCSTHGGGDGTGANIVETICRRGS